MRVLASLFGFVFAMTSSSFALPTENIKMVQDLESHDCFFYDQVDALSKLGHDVKPTDYKVIINRGMDEPAKRYIQITDPITTAMCDGGETYWVASDEFAEPPEARVVYKRDLGEIEDIDKREIIAYLQVCVGAFIQVCSVEPGGDIVRAYNTLENIVDDYGGMKKVLKNGGKLVDDGMVNSVNGILNDINSIVNTVTGDIENAFANFRK